MAVIRRQSPIPERIPPWGVLVAESHHADDFRLSERSHPFVKVLFLMDGAARFTAAGRATFVEAGDAIIVPIGQKHWMDDLPGRPVSQYLLCVDPSVWQAEPALSDELPAGRLPRHPPLQDVIRRAFRELLFEQAAARPGHRALIVSRTLELLVQLSRRKFTDDGRHTIDDSSRARVEAYIHELDRHFYEPAAIDQAADETHLSRRRFTQLFRDITGTSWLNYLTDRRIDHARRLLSETDHTVTSIAFECGFEDLSNFYRAFHKREGVSPSKWRER